MTDHKLIVAVSGGRDYADAKRVDEVLSYIHQNRGITLLIEGACPVGGADELARLWAKLNEVNCLSVPPKAKQFNWPACGPRRNAEMADWNPNIWVLFPGGKGTASAKKCAVACTAEIVEVLT